MLAKLAFLLTAPVLVAETPSLLVTLDGIPVGELRPSCDLRDRACTEIPSGATARAIGMDRDCGDVNVHGLAECLTVEVIPNPEGHRLILRSWQGGYRTPEWDCLLDPSSHPERCDDEN